MRSLIILILVLSYSNAFTFNIWTSGMTMKNIKEISKDYSFTQKDNILKTKDNLYGEDRIVLLFFTKETNKLYKLTVNLDKEPKCFKKNLLGSIGVKYKKIRNPNKKKLSFKSFSSKIASKDTYWEIDKNSYLRFRESRAYNLNILEYINMDLEKVAKKENIEFNKNKYNALDKKDKHKL